MAAQRLKIVGLVFVVISLALSAITLLSLLNGTALAPLISPASQATSAPAKLRLFDGASAMRFAQAQCAIGPRPPGTPENVKTGDFISQSLPKSWTVEEQTFAFRGVPIRNIIAKRGQGRLVIIGAHYDTRPRADNDPIDPNAPILGANDGASGVAVLLELARVLPQNLNKEVWLAFFDAEDSGNINGWPWSVGADHLAASLTTKPEAVIVLDMIGDKDQQIYYEANSNPTIQQALFAEAARLGYAANFIPTIKYSLTDDHTPFLVRGYPAVDVIDFDYPYWHTLQDTCDKIGSESLERVGRTVQGWLTK